MDRNEYHYHLLRAFAVQVGVDPDGPLCPNLREIANGDGSISEKTDELSERLRQNSQERRRPI